MNKIVVRKILLFMGIMLFFYFIGNSYLTREQNSTVIQYKGQQFILYQMVVEGHTNHGCKMEHQHGLYCAKDLVVYSPVFVDKKAHDLERWKRRYDTSPIAEHSKK